MGELGSWLEARRPALTELLSELIRARSENPPGDESAAAAIVRERLATLGMGVRVVQPAPGRVSVIGVRDGRGPAVLCNAHLDTVPSGDGWTVDPFAGEVRDGHVYGRGAIDHKSPVAALLYAVEALEAYGRLDRRLVLIFDADEETGGELGMKRVLETLTEDVETALYAMPSSYTPAAASFFAAGRDNVFNASVGRLRLSVRYTSPAYYQVAPERWWYPSEVAANVASGLPDAYQTPAWFGPRPRLRLVRQCDDEQEWELFVLPGEEAEALEESFRSALAARLEAFGGRVTAEIVRDALVPPALSPRDHPLVEAVVAGATVATGRVPHVGPLGVVTGMSPIQQRLGAPVAAFGYGHIELCHVPDERIAVDDLVFSSVAYAEALARL